MNKIEIFSCLDCKSLRSDRDYTEDSFETCFRYDCEKTGKNLLRYVDWNEKIKLDIPDWCPKLNKEKNK